MTKTDDAGGSKDSKKKMLSPYDLNSNDNPGNLITHVQLKGENYDEWARAIRTSLRARRKWSFVNETIPEPEEGSPVEEDWWTVNSMLVAWILNTIEPNLRSTMTYMEKAKDLWKDIVERFPIVNGPRIQQLRRDLAELKQKGLPIVTYYGKMKKIWEELNEYDPIPMCVCGKCTCDVGGKSMKRREMEKVHSLLMGLDDSIYGTVRSALLAMDPLPNLNKVYSTLIQEEKVRTMNIVNEEKAEKNEMVVLAAQTGSHGRGRDERREHWDPRENREQKEYRDKNLICSHCNQRGHEISSCFRIIGYPNWWGDRPREDARTSGGAGRGQNRQGRGGTGRGKGGGARANAATASSNSASYSVGNVEREIRGIPGLDGEQIQTLIDLL